MPVATRGSCKRDAHGKAELILPILLQRPCAARDQQLVCKLLCVSKTVRSRASQLLHGRLSVTVSGNKAAACTEWLAKHLHLLQALHVDIPVVHPYGASEQCNDDSDSDTDGESEVGDAEICWLCPATESQCAAAIQRAVAAAPAGSNLSTAVASLPAISAKQAMGAGLCKRRKRTLSAAPAAAGAIRAADCSVVTQPASQRSCSPTPEPLLGPCGSYPPELQSFSTDTCSIVVLEQLPCSHLTRLHLQFAADHLPFLARAAAALARFTGLQELHISPSDAAAVDEQENFKLDTLLAGVAGLSCLRSLAFEQLSDPRYMCLIPAQVQELRIGFKEPPAAGQVQLGHLTALSRLDLSNSYKHWWDSKSVLATGDVLPSSLKTIRLKDCSSVEPLLRLQHLRSLEVSSCSTTAANLQQLSSLSRLLQLSITCFGNDSVEICTPAWSDLRSLSLYLYMGGKELPAGVLQQLGRAYGIVSLSLTNFLVAASGLAGVLQGLTGLTRLSLEHGCWLMRGGEQVARRTAAHPLAAVLVAANSAVGAGAMHCGSVDCEKGSEAGPVVGAISALPHLQSLRCVWVPFGSEAVRQLQRLADQLHGGLMLHYCD